jgi:anti-sigma-K factor RskA
MQIATLQATIDDYKQGVAVVVWNAEKQQGILKLEKMPVIPANKDFQLWVLDPAQKSPVSSGTVRVDDKGFAKVEFKPTIGITQADKFAISVEKKGGVAAPEGPIVLLSN